MILTVPAPHFLIIALKAISGGRLASEAPIAVYAEYTRVLDELLCKVEYLQKDVSRLACHERRFDRVDMQLTRQCRLDAMEKELQQVVHNQGRMEKDLQKVVQNTSNLQAELRAFATDLLSRVKQVEVCPGLAD